MELTTADKVKRLEEAKKHAWEARCAAERLYNEVFALYTFAERDLRKETFKSNATMLSVLPGFGAMDSSLAGNQLEKGERVQAKRGASTHATTEVIKCTGERFELGPEMVTIDGEGASY